jgi:hypothetical protein
MSRYLVLLGIFIPCLLCAGSVRLINNSPYTLRAVIRGGDGSFLSEMVINSQKEMNWTDTYGNYGSSGGANDDVNQNYRSKTPYTVLWYCTSGDTYGVSDTVGTGSIVTSQGSIGDRMCSPPKRKESVPSTQPEGHYLYKPPESPPLDQ